MTPTYTLRHLTRQEVTNYFLKEASKACPKDSKLSWMNQYIQKGGTIPTRETSEKPFNVSSILRESRNERMMRYSIKPSTIHEIAQKTLNLIEEKQIKPGVAIDLGGGNSTLALTLLQKKWKVIVVDPSERGLHLLHTRAQLLGLGSTAQGNLSLIPKRMEEFSFPKNVDFISAQDSLPYCDADKLVYLWDKIHSSLKNGRYFTASCFNSCSFKDPLSNTDEELTRSLDDDNPDPSKEITARVELGAWMASPSVIQSLLNNCQYNIDYFALDSTSIEFIGRK